MSQRLFSANEALEEFPILDRSQSRGRGQVQGSRGRGRGKGSSGGIGNEANEFDSQPEIDDPSMQNCVVERWLKIC